MNPGFSLSYKQTRTPLRFAHSHPHPNLHATQIPLTFPYPHSKHALTRFHLKLLPATSLDNLLILLPNLLLRLPPQRRKPLRQDRVRVVVRGVHRVGVHGAQVLDLQADEGAGERLAVAEADGEGVGLELVGAGEDVHEELDDGVERGEEVREEDEADDDGLRGEGEGVVEGGVVDEDGEEGEDVDEVELETTLATSTGGLPRGRVLTWLMPKSLVVCPSFQWPSSCASTEMTSSGSLFSISVS